MMKIKKIKWISDVAKEAEVLISDGVNECIAFSHPCNLMENDVLENPLYAFIVTDLMVSYQKYWQIEKIKNVGMAYKCNALVVNSSQNLVRVGDIYIVVDEDLPVGAEDGVFVEFECARLDV